MSKIYDYVIVGGGPTGLTLALCLSKYNKSVAIIDKNESLGGCHRVHRINGLFSEHGPRIYIDNYIMFKKILKELNLDFYDLFVPYNFNMTNIGGNVTNHLTFREMFILAKKFVILNDSHKNISMDTFMNQYNFTKNAKDYVDRLCRMTDGAGSDRYTLYSFLSIANQNMMYQIYQPKKPNDVALFKYWKNALLKNNVDIYQYHNVIDATNATNTIKSLIIQDMNNNNKYEIYGKKFIFAIPPYAISQFLLSSHNTQIKDSFGELKQFFDWSEKTNYIKYIPVTFHFDKKIKLEKKWGFPSTSWGVGFIVQSDYTDFEDSRSQTVISTLITKNEKSNFTNKTPNETINKKELSDEIFRQLKQSFPNLPYPTYSILSQNYHDGTEWIPRDTSFISTQYGYLNNKSSKFDNLYNCGVCNGKSNYSFTSLESAVTNAISLLHDLESQSKTEYPIVIAIDIRTLFISVIVLIIICIVVWNYG